MTFPDEKISIAIPAFNAEKTILECLRSILNQTWSNLEVVICDDASTDATCSLIESFNDSRLRLLRNDANRGEGAARDAAIAACRGRWIALGDADDAWLPARLDVLVKATAGNERAVVFDDIMMCHDLKGRIVPWKRLRGSEAFGARAEPVPVEIGSWINAKRLLIKPFFSRGLLLESKACHSSHAFGADTYFILKLLTTGADLIYVPQALYYYRIAPGSASSNRQRYTLFCEVLGSCRDDFRDRPDVYNAFGRKIVKLRRLESYRYFLKAIRERRIGKALLLLVQSPWFLLEFSRHNIKMVIYRLHRLKYASSSRS